MIKSKFNKQTNILESEFIGDVTLVEIVNYIISIKQNKSYPKKLKIKTNATNANFTFSIDDLKTIVIENEKSLKKYNSITDVIIVGNPQTTAYSMLYKELSKNNKYRFNIFSTDNGALQWLKNN